MPVTATGPLSLPFAAARELMAATATWQDVCDANNAAEAAARIYLHDSDPPDEEAIEGEDEDPDADELVPFVVLLDEDGLVHKRKRIGSAEGQLLASFMLAVDPAMSRSDQMTTARNKVGAILEEMLALARSQISGSNYYWGMTGWDKVVTPQIVTDSEPRFGVSDAIWCVYLLEWVE